MLLKALADCGALTYLDVPSKGATLDRCGAARAAHLAPRAPPGDQLGSASDQPPYKRLYV